MNTQLILKYLSDLSENNNREWYHSHKVENKAANTEFEALIGALILRIGEFDNSVLHNEPKSLTFKLVRDTRFSHPGGQSFLGGGLFADMFKGATAMVRDYIVQNGEELESIIKEPAFQEYFTIQGSTLKNVPAGYDKEHPQAEYLKFKSWYLEYPIEDEELGNAEAFLAKAAALFQIMKPFNDYLNRALSGFQMPTR